LKSNNGLWAPLYILKGTEATALYSEVTEMPLKNVKTLAFCPLFEPGGLGTQRRCLSAFEDT
jgi:hypothetical protein